MNSIIEVWLDEQDARARDLMCDDYDPEVGANCRMCQLARIDLAAYALLRAALRLKHEMHMDHSMVPSERRAILEGLILDVDKAQGALAALVEAEK